MLLADKEHLPSVVTNIDGIRDVLLAIDPEITLMRNDISNLIKELYVKTTDKFITRWENDFGLKYDASLTLQQRRQRILNKLARKKTLNWDNLKLMIRNNTVNPMFYIVNDSANYSFRILIAEQDLNPLKTALDTAKPAYITYDIIITEFFSRYCGTFHCGSEPL